MDLIETRTALAAKHPDLSTKQMDFVAHYVANGGKGTAAAKQAGYAPASAHVEAHRLLKSDKVIKAIYELSVLSLGAHLPAALAKVAQLSAGAKSEYVQLEASKDLLDRAGMTAPKQVRVSSDVSVTFDFG